MWLQYLLYLVGALNALTGVFLLWLHCQAYSLKRMLNLSSLDEEQVNLSQHAIRKVVAFIPWSNTGYSDKFPLWLSVLIFLVGVFLLVYAGRITQGQTA